ncbi:MAG: AraC family transcriptional regulator [bacterium]|nr:AraC family transcriptional regulator [bacterium]
METNLEGVKSGYLYQDYRVFHIKEKSNKLYEYHYHEFNKIIIFLSGDVTYHIEGKSYRLKPWDVLLVNNHDVHKPVIDSNTLYDRIVIWVDDEFLKKYSEKDCDLTTCFKLADKKSFNLIRLDSDLKETLQHIINTLDASFHSDEYGSRLLSQSLFFELLIYLNRIHINNSYIYDQSSLEYDTQIIEITKYIKNNLGNDLSVDTIAKEFYLSKHYLMHKFKSKTGYTLHSYIQNKRLFKSIDLIKEGMPITSAASLCGFQDYSTFLRVFKKTYHCSPREFFKSQEGL